jgi:hypothetical protein
MCARVLARSPTPALTQKHVSARLNKFQLGLQFVTKQNFSFIFGKATFGTHCILVGRASTSYKGKELVERFMWCSWLVFRLSMASATFAETM